MGVCHFEKVAVDELDRRVARHVTGLSSWGKRFVSAAGLGGKNIKYVGLGTWYGIKGAGRLAEKATDFAIEHPTKALVGGTLGGYGIYRTVDRSNRAMNNVSPENIYQY